MSLYIKGFIIAFWLSITAVFVNTLLTTTPVTKVESGLKFCRDEKNCQHNAPNCDLQDNENKDLIKCICTPGFTGMHCESNIIPEYYTTSLSYDMTTVTYQQIQNNTASTRAAIEDQISQSYVDLPLSVERIADIQENNVVALEQIKVTSKDNVNATALDYGNLTYYVFNLTQYLNDDNGYLTTNKSKDIIIKSESSLIKVYKQYLKNEKDTGMEILNKDFISVALMKKKGKKLPKLFETEFGNFQLPFWETFQDQYNGKYVSIIIISYSTTPYFFVDANVVNTGIVKTLTLDEDMKEIKLPDPEDPVTINAESRTFSVSNKWKDMELLTSPEGAYMVVITFNYSVIAAAIDIQFTTRKECTTWGKFGNKKPSEEDHDIVVITKGVSRIVKHRAERLSPVFSNQILQMSITYKGDEAKTTPLVLISRCEDAASAGARRRRRNANGGSVARNAYQYRVAEVDLRHFNYDTAKWEASDAIKLKSGQGKDVAFESNFFGTFSASVLFIPPDTIDFHSIFLDFIGKLEENPYGLSLVLTLWVIFILIAIPLRRIDKGDAELWHYAPLIDNDPFARHTYYIAVSTAMRSARKFTSAVYFNIKGNKSQTGPRLLSDGYRENFIRGTTSHFCLTSSKELGKLKSMKIWHDNKGKYTRWLLSKIIVGDFKNNKRYVFSCGEWLSLDSIDGKTYRKLHALDEKIVDNDLLFSDLSKRHLFDDHLWFSLSKRPNFSRFTRVQRMWSVAALLFLSMITSAMFYNTPDQIGRSISLGPFKFNYKQFYVGFMSAAFAVFPSIFIMSIFKNRRFKDEVDYTEHKDVQNKKRCSCCTRGLYWWFIFLGYALIFGCIASSSFFIFLYSLDWGSTLTLEWMFAVFLGTVQSIFLMEPLKAVCLAVIMACCCAKIAQHQMADIHFPNKEETIDANQCIENGATHDKAPYIEWPHDGTETKAEKQYKRRLQLNQRLNSKLRSWILQFLYITIVLIICNHGEFEKAYRQNQHLKNMIMQSYVVNTSEHIYDWIREVYCPNVFSKWYYNGALKMSYTQRFVDDMYHFRMGLSRVRQVRVQGSCVIPVVMKNAVDICSLGYSTDSEERGNYCRDWEEFNSTCFDENEEPDYAFQYKTAEATEALSYIGTYGTYGGGGYFLDIGPKNSLAFKYIEQLRNYTWIDKSTRAVFVECMLFNANSRLFSHVKVVFELPHFGGLVHTNVDIASTNLYPYKESWDYIVLGLQVLFMAILLARLIMLFVRIIRTKCGYLLRLFGIVRVLEIGFGISAIVFYIIRIDQTIAATEKIFNDIGLFVPFEKVILMDKLYNYCIGALCFISVIDLLKPLSFNFYLHLMKTAIISSRGKLFGFMFILACVMMGFASILSLLYGHIEVEFRDIPSALLSLFRVMIGMVSFKQEMHIEEIGVILLFGLYCLMVTVIIMNLFISSLNLSFSDATEKVKNSEKHRFDSEMNDYLWWKISSICGNKGDAEDQDPPCFGSLESSPPPRGGVQVSKLQMQLIQQYRDDLQAQSQVLRTCLLLNNRIYDTKHLRCISRRLKNETQFMFLNRELMFMMMLHFHYATETAVIPAYMINAHDAIKSGVYPHTIPAQPYTAMFVVKTEMLPKDTGPVDVKIVDRSSGTNSKNMFLVSSSDGGRTWELTAAVVPTKKTPCICASLNTCPTHFQVVICDSLFTLPPQVHERSEYHMVSPSGGTYNSKTDKRISISFEPDSVTCNTQLRLAVEPCFPSAMIHILCLIDIKNNLVRINLPQTAHVHPLKSGIPRDFIALYKEGFLDTWRKVPTSVRRKNNSSFHFAIKDIKRGVQTAIFVKASDFRDPNLYTEDKDRVLRCYPLFVFEAKKNKEIHAEYVDVNGTSAPFAAQARDLSALIRTVCSHEKTAMYWCSIGEKLGLSRDVLENIKTDKSMCCEEKCSIILENWCTNTPSPVATKLQECLNSLNINIPQLEN